MGPVESTRSCNIRTKFKDKFVLNFGAWEYRYVVRTYDNLSSKEIKTVCFGAGA